MNRRAGVIGLTGGIGSGKSAAANLLVGWGAGLVDTDAIAHRLSMPGQSGALAVGKLFGSQHLNADGSVDRAKLRARVFNDSAARKQLEAALHPLIHLESVRQLRARQTQFAYVVLAVPLLLEAGQAYRSLLSGIAVVDCPEASQIQRAMARSALTESEVLAIMRQQASRADRLALADWVLPNNGSLDDLRRHAQALHGIWRQSQTA